MTTNPMVTFDRSNPPKAFVQLRDAVTDTAEMLRRLTEILDQVSSVDIDAICDTAELLRYRAAELEARALTLDHLCGTEEVA